ncbi:MAG: DUF1449 domain-containing protein [Gloeotrichia echinulata DEX184]|nr:YqiJ family protein [Gloeotrichia echinulata DEX184]
MLFSTANLPYWIFLGMGVLLFLFVIVSGGGDQDIDIDADADLEVETESEFSFGQALAWIGIGKAPFILLLATDLSLWGVLGWMLNVWVGGILNGVPSGFFGSIVLFGSLVISLFTGGLIARPIGKIFAEFGEDASSDRLIGCVGTVTSAYIPAENLGKIGQVDVIDTKRNLVTISAVLPEWATVAPERGEKVIVIELKPRIYTVTALSSNVKYNM